MSTSLALPLSAEAIIPAAPPALPDWRERLANWVGAGLSLAVVAVAIHQLGVGGLGRIALDVPLTPGFWLVFVLAYLVSPASEWLIFHRLWRLPASGMLALLRKEVSNELLFGYAGEAHFYLWARRHVPMAGSPFGAVKDVAVLSAVAGNVATLVLMAATAPLLTDFAALPGAHVFAGSIAIMVAVSLGLFLFRRAVFSLPVRDLWMIFGVHCGRIAVHVGAAALLWHLLLPQVSLAGWAALATVRQMVTRLPLVSNKDLIFAALAIFLLGKGSDAAGAIATVASLTLAAHLLVGIGAYALPFAARGLKA